MTLLRALAVAGAVLAGAAGCVGLSSQDQTAIQTSCALDVAAYRHLDGGAARADVRGAGCECAAVLRRNKLDAGVAELGCP